MHTARRLLTGSLLVAALGSGLAIAPAAAHAATVTATVKTGSALKVRALPSLSGKIVGSVSNNQKVAVQCVAAGTSVLGSMRTSNLWAKIGTGRYISWGYLSAPTAVARCATSTPQAAPALTKPPAAKPAVAAPKYITGTVRSTDGPVNIRTTPNTSGAVVLTLNSGRRVLLVCAVTGQNVAGSVRTTNQWNRTSTGHYISHGFVVTAALPVCAGAAKPVASPVLTPEQFIKAAVPGAQQGWREYGVPPSVTIAQAILESGWGRSTLSSTHKNYFGIKCQSGRFGTLANGCANYRTQECTKAGNCFMTSDYFRTYASMGHSFRDHGNFLKVNSRYKPAFQYTRNANQFIWHTWKAGYATDPNYYTKITGIMAKNKLYQYDTWK